MPGQQIKVVEALNQPTVRRMLRSPSHKFSVRAKPFEICPFLVAPVLPGETMTNALLQSRVVSDPIAHPLIGWHHEMFLFYVSIPAIASHLDNPVFTDMFIDTATSMSGEGSYIDANDVPAYYNFGGAPQYLKLAMECIIDHFFRDEADVADYTVLETYPAAYADLDRNVFQSAKTEAATGDDPELPGVDELEDLDILEGYSTHYAQWEIMRDIGLTDVTFEDYLASAGVNVPKGDVTDPSEAVSDQNMSALKHKPELLRFTRDWTYPTNHVDPTNGTPTSALSWSIKERADKHRFFKYPGFLVGLSVTRAKLYLGNQKGAGVGLMDDGLTWLPPVLNGYPYTTVLEQLDSTTTGILENATSDYWLDLKDLFLYGDQFFNYSLGGYAPALPAADVPKPKFVTDTMVDNLFATTDGTKSYIRQDGVVSFNILSRLRETTP